MPSRRTLATAAAVVALGGCGSQDTSTTKTKPAATKAAAQVSDELVGTWESRLVAPAGSDRVTTGKYTMRVRADGSVDMYVPDNNPAHDCLTEFECQSFEVQSSGGKLTVGTTAACTGGTADYAYKITGNKLTTTLVNEDCASDRRGFFDGITWRRQP